MTTPLSFASFTNTLPKKKKKKPVECDHLAPSLEKLKLVECSGVKTKTNEPKNVARRLETEEVNDDSIYSIYLKKITYTFNNSLAKQDNDSKFVTKCDQIGDASKGKAVGDPKRFDDQQSLQWETRQCRTLKAASLEHMVRYILLITPSQQLDPSWCSDGHYDEKEEEDYDEMSEEMSSLLEERNNAAHAMHVVFATYRQYVCPSQLFDTILAHRSQSSCKQFNFVLYYWLNNFPEDFWTCYARKEDGDHEDDCTSSMSCGSSSPGTSRCWVDMPLTLADQLISIRNIDEEVKKHCLHLLDMRRENVYNTTSSSHKWMGTLTRVANKKSSIVELEPKFIAQQLTAIDMENFLMLKPYTLLSSARSKTKIESMIRNFNLLSRHVILSILQSSMPHLVVSHWIEVAQNLRTMRNFNSLKAIIAGLTNESIYRLKTTVWSKLARTTSSTFESLSSIVDDVNNQLLLRQTQLIMEGTSKVSLEQSLGTIPYLGTFLTDITMINTRYPSWIELEDKTKLINFERCSKQYEILIQMQLLQKNAIAALQQQQQNYQIGTVYSLNHYLSLRSQSVPSMPRVARIFRNWFQLEVADLPNDRECYQMSQEIEGAHAKMKK